MAHLEEAVPLIREAGTAHLLSVALNNMGRAAKNMGDFDRARRLMDEAYQVTRSARRLNERFVLIYLSNLTFEQGEFDQSERFAEDLLDVASHEGVELHVAGALARLGLLKRLKGKLGDAEEYLTQGLRTAQKFRNQMLIGRIREQLGRVALDRGDIGEAFAQLSESLNLRRTLRQEADRVRTDEIRIASGLEGLARAALRGGDVRRAARLYGTVQAALTGHGITQLPHHLQFPIPQAEYEATRSAIRDQLGDDTFQNEFAEGQALSLDEAVELASSIVPQGSSQGG